jgi:hypothetical protein
MELIEDLGMIFATENSKHKVRHGIYKCSCGKEFRAAISDIKRKSTTSCGCYRKTFRLKHGMSNEKIYNTWQAMIRRCYDESFNGYENYGGRGITVCERWRDSLNFINDMSETWEHGLSIDRIDVNGNYEPSNCRWATKAVQARNIRVSRKNNTSGYKGVSFFKNSEKWVSHIGINGKIIFLGYFETAIEGANAYDKYVIENNLEHTTNDCDMFKGVKR